MGSKKKNKNKNKAPTSKETHDTLWPTTFRISARNMIRGQLAGVIFGCKHSTVKECFAKQLFGLPSLHFAYIRNIKPGLPLFLFNYSDRTLHGIFEAKSAGEMNIDRHAWISESHQETTPFPAQVRFRTKMPCQPLCEDQFKPLISGNYYEEKHFWNELDSVQTKNLIDLFSSLPRTGIASEKSSLNIPKSKQEHFSQDNVTHSLGIKGTQDSEGSCSTTDTLREQNKGTLDRSWKRSFASVVRNSNKLSETDNTGDSNSHVGYAETDVQIIRCAPEVDAPDRVGVSNFKFDEEVTGHDKLRGEEQLSDDRVSYSSAVRNTNKYPKTNICKITTAACQSSQLDQPKMQQDLVSDRCHWDCESFCSHVTEESRKTYIGREAYIQRKTMLDKSSRQVSRHNDMDDSSMETNSSMPVSPNDRESGCELVPPTTYLRTSQIKSVEVMKCMRSTQEDISDQSTEWNSLSDAIQMDGMQNAPSPKAEIMMVNHMLTMEFDPSASVSVLDKGFPSATPNHSVSNTNGSSTGSECGADSCEEAEYLTAHSDDTASFSSSDTHIVNHIIPDLLHEVESLKVSQMVQAQQIHVLVQELAESREEVRELKQRQSVLEWSWSPAFPGRNLNLTSGFEKIFNESVFLVGGFNGSSWISSVDCYVPSSDSMALVTPMRNNCCAATAIKLDDELYVLGGKDVNSHQCYSTVDSYNFLSNQWIKRPQLNQGKKGLTAVSVGSKIFAIGGVDEMSECFSDVEMFEEGLGKWIPIKSMKQKRVGAVAAEINGIIYAVGGSDGRNYLTSAERFDPRKESWNLIKSMSTPRGGHSMVVLNDKLFVMGGYNGGEVIETVEVFDPRKGWMTNEPMKACRGYGGAAVIGQSIYVMGGASNNDEMLETVECYTEERGWQVTDLKSIGKRCSFSAVVM